jgi:broad specificity phosphatase PhoE
MEPWVMAQKIRYLSHPQVHVDPAKDIQEWSLHAVGLARVEALANSNALRGTITVISSAEVKALETARPIADALGCRLEVRQKLHENDRSSTGYLPPEKFEIVADQFFAYPETSVLGWETAHAAQVRIVREVEDIIRSFSDGDILIVGHGAVGTLLFCHLSDLPISRLYDQGTGGGGCFFEFTPAERRPKAKWQPMELLIERALS